MGFFVGLLGVLVAFAAQAACQGGGCTTSGVHIIVARGTEETGVGKSGIFVEQIFNSLPGSDVVAVEYPASVAIPSSPNAGVKAMLKLVNDYAAACPDSKMVLMGYSQGTQVVASSVSGGGINTSQGGPTAKTPPLSQDVMSKVVSIVVFGDPNFIANEPYDRDGCNRSALISRSGVLATRWNSFSARMLSYCAVGDPICCGGGRNPAQHLSYFTEDIALQVAEFVSSLNAKPIEAPTTVVPDTATASAAISSPVSSTAPAANAATSQPSDARQILPSSTSLFSIFGGVFSSTSSTYTSTTSSSTSSIFSSTTPTSTSTSSTSSSRSSTRRSTTTIPSSSSSKAASTTEPRTSLNVPGAGALRPASTTTSAADGNAAARQSPSSALGLGGMAFAALQALFLLLR